MVTHSKGAWVQCQQCGHLYHIREKVPIDELYVTHECPKCKHRKGLNCGDSKDDIYFYYDPCLDERYHKY